MSADVKTPSKLEKILASGEMAVTSECGPPRGSDPEGIKEKAEMIRDYVDAINITDNQTSVTRLCSLASCIHLKLMGVEPILQMVTRDRNRIAIQSDILGAAPALKAMKAIAWGRFWCWWTSPPSRRWTR